MKITKKVAFNFASEASYFYILSRQRFIKNAKHSQFGEFLKKTEACVQTVLPERSILKGQNLVENNKIKKMQMRHLC